MLPVGEKTDGKEGKIHAHKQHSPKDLGTQEALCKKGQRERSAFAGVSGP